MLIRAMRLVKSGIDQIRLAMTFGVFVRTACITGMLLSASAGVIALSRADAERLDILSQLTVPAFFLAAFAVAVLAVVRAWFSSVVGLLVVLVLLVAVWPQWSVQTVRAGRGAEPIILYSANVHFKNEDWKAIRASIQRANPDIVVLIEVSPVAFARMETILAGRYPYRVFKKTKGPDALLVASRFPLSRMPDPGVYNLTYVLARASTPKGPLVLAGVHLTRPWPYDRDSKQRRQARDLERVLSAVSGPKIVAGDFNSVSSGFVGRAIQSSAGLVPGPGWPGTWPSSVPAAIGVTIDQVYHSPDIATGWRKVGSDNGSDHRPVVTQLLIP